MGISAKAVANYFLDLAGQEGKKLTPLKLQKLVFVAHGWYLAINGNSLVEDEFAEAWQYGPVFPSLYHEFKDLGRDTIDRQATKMSVTKNASGGFDIDISEPELPDDAREAKDVIDQVWSSYGKLSGLQLSDMTHRDGTPWEKVRTETAGVNNADIPNDDIRQHYVDLALKRRAAREQGSGQAT
jgi:uncharacterized phage-associated protein